MGTATADGLCSGAGAARRAGPAVHLQPATGTADTTRVAIRGRAGRRDRPGQQGFTLLEVVVAISLFALVAAGLAASAGSGLHLVGTSNARQTATQLAVAQMELLRGTPYDGVGLSDTPVTRQAAPDPDADVSADGMSYSVPGGTLEPLVAGGPSGHRAPTESRNGVAFDVYRYITWVDDPATATTTQDYKRVTVVVRWSGRDAGGNANRHVLSSVFSPGSVSWGVPASTTTTTAPTTTTTTTPPTTTTTTPPPACASDTTPPTPGSPAIAILAGTGALTSYTSTSTVELSLSATDNCPGSLTMLLSNDGTTFTSLPYATSRTWTLASGQGSRTVYAKFKDAAGNVSTTAQASVRVDSTKPSTPSGFTGNLSQNPTRVTLTWNVSTDNDTLIGYRIYRSIGNGAFQNFRTVSASAAGAPPTCVASPCTYEDVTVQTGSRYSYYVVAYDAAGNESDATQTITR